MKKKLLSALLVVCVLLSCMTGMAFAAAGFVDVPEGEWYTDAVQWAVSKQITNGTSAATFSPDDTCTRAQMVTFLWRANSGKPVRGNMPFNDVPKDAYYRNAVLWAVNEKITTGTSNTTFSPDNTVTRAEAVTFLWRAAGSPTSFMANPFADVPADAYYTDAVIWAAGEGVTTGVSADSFSPDAPCTRAQIVTFLYRAANRAAEVKALGAPKYPVVMVHGAFGWGSNDNLSKVLTYYGMFNGSVEQYLESKGAEVYCPSVGPFSSAWDRACELYAQLTGTVTDYGAAHAAMYGHDRYGRDYTRSRMLKGPWDANHPVNLVGHSFGGVTVRLLEELLRNGSAEEQAYMRSHPGEKAISPLFTGGKDGWVYSVTTLAAPANGMNLFESMETFTTVGAQLVEEVCKLAGITFVKDIYDPQLEHFGIMPKPGSTIMEAIKGVLTEEFVAHNDSCFQDLTIDKSLYLNQDITMNSKIYYFSYYGNRMVINGNGQMNTPNGRMFPVAMVTGMFMGNYDGVTSGQFKTGYGPTLSTVTVPQTKVGAVWHKNDGIVNSCACMYPAHYQNGVLVEDPHQFVGTETVRTVRPGVWYVMPEQNMDHFSFMGGILTESQQTVRSFYDGVIENIVRCGG